MELSSIAYSHRDSHTDQLYKPLRQAIQQLSNQKMQHLQQISASKAGTSIFTSRVRKSSHSNTQLGQNKIIEATFVPLNMHLVQTNNPLKRIKARSRSYRAISMDQVVKQPIRDENFIKNLKFNTPRTKQIIYDYEPSAYQSEKMIAHPLLGGMMTRGQMQMRSRSLPYISSSRPPSSPQEFLTGRVERVQSTTMEIRRRTPTSATSIKTQEDPEVRQQPMPYMMQQVKPAKKVKKQKIPDFSSDYYQNCNKYIFSKNIKQQKTATRPSKISKALSPGHPRESSRSNSNYKYNLFSILDEQTNQNCTTGFCTKNQLVASKIKKRW